MVTKRSTAEVYGEGSMLPVHINFCLQDQASNKKNQIKIQTFVSQDYRTTKLGCMKIQTKTNAAKCDQIMLSTPHSLVP